jgi:hypothetical protein
MCLPSRLYLGFGLSRKPRPPPCVLQCRVLDAPSQKTAAPILSLGGNAKAVVDEKQLQFCRNDQFELEGFGVFGTLGVSLRRTNSCIRLKTAVLPMLIAVFSKIAAGPFRSLAG